jgi:hypothetical protein
MNRKDILYLILLLILACLIPANTVTGAEPKGITSSDLVGIWQMCFDPAGVIEADNGYLIIEPDGKYLRMLNDYNWEKLQSVESGSYTIKGDMIVFFPKKQQALKNPEAPYFTEEKRDWKQYELYYVKNVKVILSHQGRSENRTILRWKDSTNYSYAKIY